VFGGKLALLALGGALRQCFKRLRRLIQQTIGYGRLLFSRQESTRKLLAFMVARARGGAFVALRLIKVC
jgi:hypothetical protein